MLDDDIGTVSSVISLAEFINKEQTALSRFINYYTQLYPQIHQFMVFNSPQLRSECTAELNLDRNKNCSSGAEVAGEIYSIFSFLSTSADNYKWRSINQCP